MEIAKAVIDGNEIRKTNVKIIKQNQLTLDCWNIQFWGIIACDKCEYLNTSECGGKRIRKLIQQGKYPVSGLPDQKK